MREQQPRFFVGLDVGTSKVRCVIGAMDADSEHPQLSVIGHGMSENTGMRKGLVVHLEEVTSAVHKAVNEAERLAGLKVHQATVNVNGVHVNGIDSKGVIAISAANREITIHDKMRAEEAATIVQLPSNREIIQVFPKNYRVDGHDSVKDPEGMRGVRLEVDTHIVTVAIPNLRNLHAAITGAQIHPSHHTVSGLAAAEAVLNRKQKEAGTLVLDIGASTTNLAIIEDGEIQHVSVIPMGGNNITNDLAIGLKIDLDIAEEVKLKHAALSGHHKSGKVSVQHDSRNHVFEGDDISMIVEARVDEIFEFIENKLDKIEKSRKLPGGVVIVGGTSNIPGISEFAKEKLQLAARTGSLQKLGGIADDIQDLSFVTAIGLMELDMLFSEHGTEAIGSMPSGFLDNISNIWRKIKQ